MAYIWRELKTIFNAVRIRARACRASWCASALIFISFATLSISAQAEDLGPMVGQIMDDVSTLEYVWNLDRANVYKDYLSNISSKTSTLYTDFNNIIRPSITSISNYVALIRQEVQKENTNLTNIVGRVNFWGTALDIDLQTANRYLHNTVLNLQSIDYNLWEAYKGETNIMTRIYDELATNVVQNANEMLSQLSNINLWVEEQLYTNSTHYAQVELSLSNLFSSANSMSNNLVSIDNNISTVTNLLNNIDTNLNDFYTYYTNTTRTVLLQWYISRTLGNSLVSQFIQDTRNLMNGNLDWRYIYNTYIDGENFYPSGWFTTSGMAYNIAGLLQSLVPLESYIALYGGISSEIITNAYNTITNKTQSIPYTVILPEISASTGEPNIYGALTNAYLTSYNQQSDKTWFDRVELLLAALVFQDNVNTNGNGNSWGLDVNSVSTGNIDTQFGNYQTGVTALQNSASNYRNSALGLLRNIQSKFSNVSNTGIEWNTGIDGNVYFGISTDSPFFTLLRTCSIICWSCSFLYAIIKLFLFIAPYIFKGFKLAFNIVSALVMR